MKTFIVTPTYNEYENIRKLVPAVLDVHPEAEIVIVDDNSPDGTGHLADQLMQEHPGVHVIHRPEKAGLGTAYVTGFKYALDKGADCVFEMDADFSHDPREIPSFLTAIRESDVVIGSRYMNGVRVEGWRFRRLLLSKFANIFVSHLMIYPPIKDYTAGYRCYRRSVLEAIDLDAVQSDGYAFQIEMTWRANRHGFRITEIPIIFRERENGFSKISRQVVREAVLITLKHRAPLRDILRVIASNYRRYLFLED